MRLEFLGAAHEVTGSCTLLTACGKHILIDCGMEQGRDIYENCDLPVAPQQVDALLLTHAHIDHSGKIPLLVKNGFAGPVFTTAATERLCRIMLMDSAHIQEFEAEWRNRKAKRAGREPYVPMYTTADAEQALRQFTPCSYEQAQEIAPGITAEFFDAGHLLGSACIRITAQEEDGPHTVLFSGDLGNVERPLIRDPQPPAAAEAVVVESTYGDRLHKPHPDYVAQLTEIFCETFARGGNVVIPAFAVGRTQELLYCIRQIKEQRLVKGHEDFPVYIDSPLAIEATRIYSGGLTEYYDEDTLALLERGVEPIQFDGLHTAVTSEESQAINTDKTPKVIISASGMCEAGRVRHHLKHNLWRPESTILFVGYQTPGTLGNQLLNGAASVKLFSEEIKVAAAIRQVDGISGHADRAHLLEWLAAMSPAPRQVFVNHGEDTVCDGFADAVRDELHLPALAPYNGAAYELNAGGITSVKAGNAQKLQKNSAKNTRTNTVYDRLLAVYQRLGTLIAQGKGRANKELSRLADQLQSLCDRFE